MTFDAKEYLRQFDPFRDEHGWVREPPEEYALRMRGGLLQNWPEEVLIEWLHRHNAESDCYAFLGFENFRFRHERWCLGDVPDRVAFRDPSFCDNFEDVERRSQTLQGDWLAHFMIGAGTWNTSPVFLDNRSQRILFPSGEPLKTPYHLLEGHRRLSFLNGLRKNGKANTHHDVWVVDLVARGEK
ncbi:hypothetical protein [Algiphilus sp.]|uniref:hypothetical protein n=1 Tax=Algiphilus sp. TaxID=1872431 RepID=UPI0025C63AF2|nr:hypothetical protein [Algiphilus sp.]MCK5771674.1 hypothetical protein [Algiphilus sp.]